MPTSGFTGGYSYRTTNRGAFVKILSGFIIILAVPE